MPRTLIKDITFWLVDTETTGSDPDVCKIVDLGMVFAIPHKDKGGKYTLKIQGWDARLVDPGIPIPAEASAIHHLVDEDVTGQLDAFSAFTSGPIRRKGNPVLAVGHNLDFDWKVLTNNLVSPEGGTGLRMIELLDFGFDCRAGLDTLRLSRLLLPKGKEGSPEHHNQATLFYHFGGRTHLLLKPGMVRKSDVSVTNFHRAFFDCLVLKYVLENLLDRWNPEWPFQEVDDLLDTSMRIESLETFPLGKHKGKPIRELPADYMQWWLLKRDEKREDQALLDYSVAVVLYVMNPRGFNRECLIPIMERCLNILQSRPYPVRWDSNQVIEETTNGS
jgi:exodeoxyribonuclease X